MTPEEAIEAARELLGRLLASKSQDGVAFGRALRRLEMLSPARLRDLCDPSKRHKFATLVEDARSGVTLAEAEAYEWGALAVSCAGNMPPPLCKYIADKLFEKAEAVRRKRGKHPNAKLPRDFVIMYTIARVSKHGFQPTRNRTQNSQQSACSIVTEALKRVGIHMSEDNVEKIWQGRSQLSEDLREYIEGEARIPTGFPLEAH